jgi:hypothetical protein
MPCTSVKVQQRFGVTYFFHLQGKETRGKAVAIRSVVSLAPVYARYLLALIFNPEYGNIIFLRNVSERQKYSASFSGKH